MSSTDNPDVAAARAELDAVRAEAASLRRQLGESPEQVRELEGRVDSLSLRNAKLMDTLKEARQQLIALREEVDRLGQPPSGYGVLLSVFEDGTVDVFTSGRKMRLTCSPNIEADSLAPGQTVRLNEALTIVEACTFDQVGEISTLRELLGDGSRALVVGHADEERVVWLANEGPGVLDGIRTRLDVPSAEPSNGYFILCTDGQPAAVGDPHGAWIRWPE